MGLASARRVVSAAIAGGSDLSFSAACATAGRMAPAVTARELLLRNPRRESNRTSGKDKDTHYKEEYRCASAIRDSGPWGFWREVDPVLEPSARLFQQDCLLEWYMPY